jgi:hypothetical protein
MSDCPCLQANVRITQVLANFKCFKHTASKRLLVTLYKSISIVVRLCAGRSTFYSWQGQDISLSFSQKCSDQLCSPPSHLLYCYWGERQLVHLADHSLPSRVEVRSEWSYTSVIMVCAGAALLFTMVSNGQIFFLFMILVHELQKHSWMRE